MEKLTKENFWNDAFKKWPTEVGVFCKWIDEYKKRVEWTKLLGDDIKYHDLPIGMQIGIFIQFTFETVKHNDFFDGTGPFEMDQFVEGMRDWFAYENASEKEEQANYDSLEAEEHF